MAWSTRQLADLAGVTLRTVRWYHEAGLLDEPERRANGYKRYGISHLVRVLRIKRLTDLGLSPSKVRDLGDGGSVDAFQLLDDELSATIERLQLVRSELALVISDGAPIDLPPGFLSVRRDLTDADRALVLLYSRVFDQELMGQLRRALDRPRSPAEADFDFIPADADAATRAAVASGYAAHVAQLMVDFPALASPDRHVVEGLTNAKATLHAALEDLYNPAQLDVLSRIGADTR